MDNVPIASNSDSSPGLISQHRTLDGFLAAVFRADGIMLMQLDPLTTLLVRTHNSAYRIGLLTAHRGDVPVQGGTFFAEPSRACLNGSSGGGSCLTLAWLGVGLHLAFHTGGQCSTLRKLKLKRK